MCVLSGKEIDRRGKEIFNEGSWSPECCQEASYDLRVDTGPFLRIGGKLYEKGSCYTKTHIKIEPGELAMLPTVESFCMPEDLVGSIKIKFSHSRQGLTPLFGPKIDPYFGRGHKDERLYLWVSNLGMSTIIIERGEPVFTVQFHTLVGAPPEFKKKDQIGPTVAKEARKITGQNLGFMDTMKRQVTDNLDSRISRVEHGTQQVVVFGVFLVASALLAGAITAMFAMVFALNTDSGAAAVDALEGSILGYLLISACAGLVLAIVVLLVAAVVQLCRIWKGVTAQRI